MLKKNKLKDLIYIQENKPCGKEAITSVFRAVLEPILEAPEENGVVLYRLNNKEQFSGLLKRLTYTKTEVLDFSNDGGLIKEEIWEKTEFVYVLTQRYGAIFIWDYDTEDMVDFAGWYLLHNSITMRDAYEIIEENSLKDISEYKEQYKPDRRDNILLNNSIKKIVDALNENLQEAIIADMEKDSLVKNTDAQKRLEFINSKSRHVVHEIRNQLSICELYTNIIQKFCDNDKNSSCMNAIECIKTAVKISASSLMDLKSLDNNDLQVYNLKNIIKKAHDLTKIYATGKEIEFVLDIKDEEVSILADENKFLAALTNLIKNAVEAIDKKGIINITASVNDDFARIVISNNGSKIHTEKQAHIFEEGYTTKVEGSGLGLYLCKKSLEEQFARLELLKSDENSTEFEIQISIV